LDRKGNGLIFVFNLTPIPRYKYAIGVPDTEYYEEIEEKKHTSSISRPQTSNSVMKASAEFKLLNSYVSKSSYISTSLRLNDIQGYSAAGILVIDNGIYDLIKESRNGVIALSIPGGKRDSISETPSQTALREYKEEGGKYDLSPSDLTTVLWYAPGHYALYIVVKGKRPTSLSLPQSQLHKFTYDILTTYFDLS
jgi:8-oxo-dGTP pyrophosphatase MutT (NUDIX family)